MDLIGRIQPLIILLAAGAGLILGAFIPGAKPSILIEIFLMLLLYLLFLSVDLKRIGKAFMNYKFTLSSVFLNFIITPVIAFALGNIFFPGEVDIRIGLLMLLVTPCTDWYLVFTSMSRGNVELGLSILPLNLILQILLMPVYLYLFIGRDADIAGASLVSSMVIVLVIPFMLSSVTKLLIKNRNGAQEFLSRNNDHLQLLFLCLAVAAMFASEGKSLLENPGLLFRMFIPLLIFFAVAFIISRLIGRLMHFPDEDTTALSFTCLARNSPLSLSIAVAVFPNSPLISLALVIGPLIELPVLSIISGIVLKINRRELQ